MCGIGAIWRLRTKNGRNKNKADASFESLLTHLLWVNKARGPDSFGYAIQSLNAAKKPVVDRRLGSDYEGFISMLLRRSGYYMAVFNFRGIPTTESASTDLRQDEIQPFVLGNSAVVHNGIISNDQEISRSKKMTSREGHDIDSYCLLDLPVDAGATNFNRAVAKLQGSFSFLRLHRDTANMMVSLDIAANYLGCNMYLAETPSGDQYFLVSSEPLAVGVFPLVALPKLSYETLQLSSYEGEYDELSQFHQLVHALRQSFAPPPCDDAIVVISGGLDSTLTAYEIADTLIDGERLLLLHFNYGCRATTREIEAVHETAKRLRLRYPDLYIDVQVHDMSWLKALGASTLTDDTQTVAEGEVGAETASEWVPARNLAMIGVAASIADAKGYGIIALGLNREEASVYSDNSSEFYQALSPALSLGTKNRVRLEMPLGNMMKHHIVKEMAERGIPFTSTWSCYHGGEHRCGTCGPDINTHRALLMNGLEDPFTYDTPDGKFPPLSSD